MIYTEDNPLKINKPLPFNAQRVIEGLDTSKFNGVIKSSYDSYGWYQDGKLYKMINDEGKTIYYSGKTQYHRTDGPAIVAPSGRCSYWLDGILYSEDDWRKEIQKRGLVTPEYFKNLL